MSAALASLAGIAGLVPRTHAVRTRLDALGPVAAVEALEALLGSTAHPDLLLACGLALAGIDVAPLRAAAEGRAALTALALSEAPAHRALAPGGRLPDIGMLEDGPCTPRAYVLEVEYLYEKAYEGDAFPYRNWFWKVVGEELHRVKLPTFGRDFEARRHTFVARAAKHPSARFLARLVRRPDTTPRELVSIAARRPTTPAIVQALVDHAPAIALASVRLAIVCNPFTPTRTALLLAPSLRGHLATIARANIHPLVREFACLLRVSSPDRDP